MNRILFAGSLLAFSTNAIAKTLPDDLAPWGSNVRIKPVAAHQGRHVIHSYFNTCPESPDGKHVVYYTSGTQDGESGDIRIQERCSGKETVIADNITAEDAHRAACQQWCNGGKTVAYHDCRDGRWLVLAYNLETGVSKVMAKDRQLGFGTPGSPWIPLYGCHWNPGQHRDLELANVETGEIRTVVTILDVLKEYPEWIDRQFGTKDVSIFFPVMSPDGQRVFFKMSRPSGGTDYRSKQASFRAGKIVYDLGEKDFVRLFERWGHPAWFPDNQTIIERGNVGFDIRTGKGKRHAPACFSDHPSVSPDGKLFVTDADVTKRELGKPGDWAIGVGSTQADNYVVIDIFGNSKGARTWRHNHPHPVFNATGDRIYYNTNEGQWTTLRVATIGKR